MHSFIIFLKIFIINWTTLLTVIFVDKNIYENFIENHDFLYNIAGVWATLSLIMIVVGVIWLALII